jgi:uncharacterized peroxidase-related enzyme
VQIMQDYTVADLDTPDRLILDFATKLTRSPARVTADDLQPLRAAGLDDGAIHDVVQVVALFNYFNRVADGLGIDPEK